MIKFNSEQFKIILLWFVQSLIWCKQKVKNYRKKAMIKLVKWGVIKFILNKIGYRPYIKVVINNEDEYGDIDLDLYKDIQIISAVNEDGKDIIDFAYIFFKYHDHNIKLLSRVYKYLYGNDIKSLKIKYKNCRNYIETYQKILEEYNNRDLDSSSDNIKDIDDIIIEKYMLNQIDKLQEIEVDIINNKYIKSPFSISSHHSSNSNILFGLILF